MIKFSMPILSGVELTKSNKSIYDLIFMDILCIKHSKVIPYVSLIYGIFKNTNFISVNL